jgi:pimeloyl-ACP methyl ester carboxylesterase
MPVLITHGRRDPVIPVEFARRAHALLPWSEYLETDAAHAIPREAAEQAARLVAAAG